MREDVLEVLKGRYEAAEKYQTSNGVQFQLSFEQFLTLWTPYRINKLGELLDSGRIKAYLRDRENRPVCSWKKTEDKDGGVMTVHNAQIMTAAQSVFKFGIKAGEKHTPATIAKMRKPKSKKHRNNMKGEKSQAHKDAMREAAQKRWAAVRAANAAATGGAV